MLYKSLLAGAFIMMTAHTAVAQVVALGSTARGGTSQIGRALSAAVSEASPLQMRPQEVANTADYIPLVNAGELEFGIANVVQTYFAYTGTGMSDGRPNENLRMVATLMPFRAGFIVPADSDVQSVSDLKGKRVPSFSKGALGEHVVNAYLANAGMTPDDVSNVPVPNFPRMWASFGEGSTDVTVVVVGAATAREFHATMGGIRYIDFDESEEAVTRMNEWLPQMYLLRVDPSSGIPGIEAPTDVMAYDYTLFASKDTSDEQVYEVVKALYESEENLLATGPFFDGFDGDRMGKDVNLPYHPGAVKFFEEKGIWNR
ncbi:MAG: TAXI family TRAP transporter solute-binding subunit [Roseibium sp.]|nr:TAXI family TRAP transporter solute-binding subunit [Roseibium sp.]